MKKIHAKPSFYALMFEPIKEIGLKYGYNIVLHGSINRDLDLIAIPWIYNMSSHSEMIEEICNYIGGEIMINSDGRIFSDKPHGRICYIINILRNGYCELMEGEKYIEDQQYYLDISVTPTLN